MGAVALYTTNAIENLLTGGFATHPTKKNKFQSTNSALESMHRMSADLYVESQNLFHGLLKIALCNISSSRTECLLESNELDKIDLVLHDVNCIKIDFLLQDRHYSQPYHHHKIASQTTPTVAM